MKNGFIGAAAASPEVRVADCAYNTSGIIEAMRAAYARGIRLIVFPELAICGCTCGDLLFQETLLDACEASLEGLLRETASLDMVACVGLPVRYNGGLYDAAAVICGGKLLGVVPKTPIPGSDELSEQRYFAVPSQGNGVCLLAGQEAPFGTRLLFRMTAMPEFTLGVELCGDILMPSPPSSALALAGATVIANLSASNEVVGKAALRRSMVAGDSLRLLSGYLCANSGRGESTTDLVFGANNFVAENGKILAESAPFAGGYAASEIDVSLLCYERRRIASYPHRGAESHEVIPMDIAMIDTPLTRSFPQKPFVPADDADRAGRCELIIRMQAEGLAKRISHIGAKKAIIGISGGLDSCLALLVAVRAMELLSRPASDVMAITMPCFGTTERTRSNAEILSLRLGAEFSCIDISETILSHFRDIGQDPDAHDVVFENAQARCRTYVLMDIANKTGGLVVGTGDLSELALGWATYNGDHMSMYGVNASVPKTLIRHIVAYCADTAADAELSAVLRDILYTPVSPELLPSDKGEMTQLTEDIVGPYELHDFILYYAIHRGFTPSKVFRLLCLSFAGDYDRDTLKKWLCSFYRRFFAQQYKRSCLPDGPKVGSVSLSPRGDWRMPSDAVAALWRSEAESL